MAPARSVYFRQNTVSFKSTSSRELSMKGGKKGRKKIRLPSLGKLNLKADDDNGPTSPVHTTQHLVLKNPENGLELQKPVQSKGSCRGKNQKKTTRIRQPRKSSITLAGRKVGRKVLHGRKRKLQRLYPVTSSEYSFTNSLKPSDSSSYSTSYRNSNSLFYDDSGSSTLDDGSEYYYTIDSKDAFHDYGSSPYYDSDSEGSTRNGVVWDVPNRQPGAGQWYLKYDPKILGKGSFATVYLSYSKANKKYFAVKCANGGRPSTLKSLTREADILKKLNCPYLIEYLGECRVPVTLKPSRPGTSSKPVPMVTEIYLPYMKKTLADLIRACLRKKRMMKESLIRNYTTQILRGLSYLHSKNIVHCDLKGSNILVGKTHLKISDFGCSKHVIPNQNRRLISRAGTRAWMAPEVRMRAEQGFPADVWSMGCTVVQMITGKPPVGKLVSFLESNTTSAPPDIIPKEFKCFSSECISFLGKCFLKDPKARWTCQQLLEHPFLKAK